MSETVNTIIFDALQLLGVQASEEPLENADAQTAIRALNRMMSAWSARGTDLGYAAVDEVSDTVNVYDGAYEGISANLAVRLAPYYEKTVTQELRDLAKEGYSAILHLTSNMGASEFPDTLPVGAGNTDNLETGGNKFYPDYEADIYNGIL